MALPYTFNVSATETQTIDVSDYTNYAWFNTQRVVLGYSYPNLIGSQVALVEALKYRITTLNAGFNTTASSVTLGAGTKSITVAPGLAYAPGQPVRVAKSPDPANYREDGIVVSYDGGTGVLTYTADAATIVGAGTISPVTVTQGGVQGPAGPAGADGADGAPGTVTADAYTRVAFLQATYAATIN